MFNTPCNYHLFHCTSGCCIAAAAHSGALGCVKVLLDHGADVNFGGRSGQLPLYLAVKGINRESMSIIKLLIEKGAKIDIPYVNGW